MTFIIHTILYASVLWAGSTAGSIPGSPAGSWTFGVRVNRAYRTNTHVHADLNNIMMLYTVYFYLPSIKTCIAQGNAIGNA